MSEARRDDGPYAEFNHGRRRRRPQGRTRARWRGSGGGPETVAKAIEKAITRRRPKTRYPVTPSAHLALTQRALFTDRMWDRVVGRSSRAPE